MHGSAARELTADIVAALRAGTHHAVTLTLTTLSGWEGNARAALAGFVAVLSRRAADATILAVLSNDGVAARWHVHALVLGAELRTPNKFTIWWTRLGGRSARSARVAQSGRVVEHRDAWHVVTHHLGRSEGPDRVTIAGPLAGPWARFLGSGAATVAHSPCEGAAPPPKASRRIQKSYAARHRRRWRSFLQACVGTALNGFLVGRGGI